MKKKHILIFGGSGFIGKHLSDLLISKNYDVTIFDLEKKELNKKAKFIKGNILDINKVHKAIKGKDIIFHFAGEADIYAANSFPLEAVKKNILGTTNILEGAVKYKVKRFIFASSIYVFSEQGGVYRTTKQSCELLIENYSSIFGLKYTNLRFGSIYGAGANEFNFIHKMLNDAISKKRMIRNGDGSEIRNYINVSDVAKYCLFSMQKKYENKNVMLLGKEKKTIRQVLNLIRSLLGNNIKIKYTGKRDFAHYSTTPFNFLPRKAEILNKFTEINFREGLIHIIEEIIKKKNDKKNKNKKKCQNINIR